MNFREYQELSKRTMPKMVVGKYHIYYDKTAISESCLGLAGETGELIELVKKELFQGHTPSDEKKMYEIGDVLCYLTWLCTMYGYSLEQVATMNIFKRNKRYPDGFNTKDSVKRKDVE